MELAFYGLTLLTMSTLQFLSYQSCLCVLVPNSHLLQHHFRDVTLPPLTVTEITLLRMTVALAAILVPHLCTQSRKFSCVCWVIVPVAILLEHFWSHTQSYQCGRHPF